MAGRRLISSLTSGLAVLALSVCPSLAQSSTEVDLELVLAVDVSISTNFQEAATQRRGYVEAFGHPDVIAAISDGPLGRIVVTYLEWSGADYHEVLVPWTLIDGTETANAFVRQLRNVPLRRAYTTSISEALLYSAGLIETNEYQGLRRIIDISGDGPNNAGTTLAEARQAVIERGITINGLPIVLRRDDPWLHVFEGGVASYYSDCVIGGDGAFAVPVTAIADFPVAIRQKLILEIADLGETMPQLREAPRLLPVQAVPFPRPIDCPLTEPM